MYKEYFNKAMETKKNELQNLIIKVQKELKTLKAIEVKHKKDGGDFIDLKKNFTQVTDITKRYNRASNTIYQYDLYFLDSYNNFSIYLDDYTGLKFDDSRTEVENIYYFISLHIKKREIYYQELIKQYDNFYDYVDKIAVIYEELFNLLENRNDSLLHDYNNKYYNTCLYYDLLEIFKKGL